MTERSLAASAAAAAATAAPPRLTVRHDYLQAAYRRDSLVVVLAPAIGFAGAVAWAIAYGIAPLDLAFVVGMYTVASVGIDVGYHRYFAHRAFKAARWMRALLAIMGAMAAQGRVVRWVSNHRRHHAFSDRPEDPHSPHAGFPATRRFQGTLGNLWHSHVSWIFTHEPTNAVLFAKDIVADPLLAVINRFYLAWLLLAVALPGTIGWAVRGTAWGLLEGVLFGWAVPVFLSQQAAFCVNSFGHFLGRRPFATDDRSGNVGWLALPSIGAGWQNNHHAFPSAAITGVEWWEFDFGGAVLRVLEKLGVVGDLVTPTPAMVAARRTHVSTGGAGS